MYLIFTSPSENLKFPLQEEMPAFFDVKAKFVTALRESLS